MSTILEAHRELERRASSRRASCAPVRRSRRVPLAGALIACGMFATAGALGWRLMVGDPPEALVERAPAVPRATATANDLPPAPPPRAEAPLRAAEQPWAEVTDAAFAGRRPPPAPIEQRTASGTPAREPVVRPAKTQGPRVRVQSIAFARSAAERTVTLAVDGHPVSMRQGESAHGIEVQLILPDSVYVREGASVFALTPGR